MLTNQHFFYLRGRVRKLPIDETQPLISMDDKFFTYNIYRITKDL